MPEKEKYVSPDVEVFLMEKDVLTLSGISTSSQEFGVVGAYEFGKWQE